jgi:hypothetical protein
LLARAALVVKGDDVLGGSRHVRDDEADTRIEFTPMPFDLGDHPARFRPASGLIGVVARIRRGLAFGQKEAVEGWFVKLPSGFPSDAEQAQRRSSASFREDEIQGQELGFL